MSNSETLENLVKSKCLKIIPERYVYVTKVYNFGDCKEIHYFSSEKKAKDFKERIEEDAEYGTTVSYIKEVLD